jgi:hypothetical protein
MFWCPVPRLRERACFRGLFAGVAKRSTKTATLAIEVVRSRLSLELRTFGRERPVWSAPARCNPSLRV